MKITQNRVHREHLQQMQQQQQNEQIKASKHSWKHWHKLIGSDLSSYLTSSPQSFSLSTSGYIVIGPKNHFGSCAWLNLCYCQCLRQLVMACICGGRICNAGGRHFSERGNGGKIVSAWGESKLSMSLYVVQEACLMSVHIGTFARLCAESLGAQKRLASRP